MAAVGNPKRTRYMDRDTESSLGDDLQEGLHPMGDAEESSDEQGPEGSSTVSGSVGREKDLDDDEAGGYDSEDVPLNSRRPSHGSGDSNSLQTTDVSMDGPSGTHERGDMEDEEGVSVEQRLPMNPNEDNSSSGKLSDHWSFRVWEAFHSFAHPNATEDLFGHKVETSDSLIQRTHASLKEMSQKERELQELSELTNRK
jgi:hypothetical protein